MKFEYLVAVGAAVLLGGFVVNGAQPAHASRDIPVPEPVSAKPSTASNATTPAAPVPAEFAHLPTGWVETFLVTTKRGPRVCPPGTLFNTVLEDKACSLKPPVTVAEYAQLLVKACPGAVVVSATPVRRPSGQVGMVFAFREGAVACSDIGGTRAIGWPDR